MKYLCKVCSTECTGDNIEHIVSLNKLCPKHNSEKVANSLRRVKPTKYKK